MDEKISFPLILLLRDCAHLKVISRKLTKTWPRRRPVVHVVQVEGGESHVGLGGWGQQSKFVQKLATDTLVES